MSLTLELNFWNFEQKAKKTVDALSKNGFTALYFQNRKEASEYILKEAKESKTVGFGGSMTIKDMDLEKEFINEGKEIYNHNMPNLSPEEKINIMRKAMLSDLYLCSANAITTTGVIINIDATGNRVGSMLFGPKKVIIVAGRNKIIEGDVTDAIKHIKSLASPPNARRLKMKTPCAETGFCSDCNSSDRICRIISIIERRPRLTDFQVILINEELGF